jgi:hypothetical protein
MITFPVRVLSKQRNETARTKRIAMLARSTVPTLFPFFTVIPRHNSSIRMSRVFLSFRALFWPSRNSNSTAPRHHRQSHETTFFESTIKSQRLLPHINPHRNHHWKLSPQQFSPSPACGQSSSLTSLAAAASV